MKCPTSADVAGMGKILIFLLLFISLHAAADSLTSFASNLDTTLRQLNQKGSILCQDKELTEVRSRTAQSGNRKASVMSEADVQKLFRELKSNADIPFEFSVAGCEERAHEMSRLMLLKGITPLKVFASVDTDEAPRLRRPHPTKQGTTVNWKYHVAPVILVSKGSELVPYVMDPSLESKAIPVSEWQAAMTRHDPKMKVRLKFTPASQYDEDGYLIVNFKDNDFNSSIQQTLKDHKARNKEPDGEDQLLFELQRDYERFMMFDPG